MPGRQQWRRIEVRSCAGAGRMTVAIAAVAAAYLFGAPATAQTYGLATMQPGTLAHTTGTAIAKVLKDKGGLNTLVQTTAGETVLIPMVAQRRNRSRRRQPCRGAGAGGRQRPQPAGRPAADRRDPPALGVVLCPQGHDDEHQRRHEGQAYRARLFGHAHGRHAGPGAACARRAHRQGCHAGAGAERDARRRRLHLGRG